MVIQNRRAWTIAYLPRRQGGQAQALNISYWIIRLFRPKDDQPLAEVDFHSVHGGATAGTKAKNLSSPVKTKIGCRYNCGLILSKYAK